MNSTAQERLDLITQHLGITMDQWCELAITEFEQRINDARSSSPSDPIFQLLTIEQVKAIILKNGFVQIPAKTSRYLLFQGHADANGLPLDLALPTKKGSNWARMVSSVIDLLAALNDTTPYKMIGVALTGQVVADE